MMGDEKSNQQQVMEDVNRLAPVAAGERIDSVDVLRGFALLGILVINIVGYGLPSAVLFNPTVAGGITGANLVTWQVSYLLFFQKMMAIFSMLFGAGLVLMHERAEQRGRKSFASVYYRRILWLLIFGLAHAYLLWFGDILYFYAMCGLLLYPLRRRSPGLLIGLGAVLLIIGMLISVGLGFSMGFMRDQGTMAQEILDSGKTLTPEQEGILEGWTGMREGFDPTPEQLAKEYDTYRGGFIGIFNSRAIQSLVLQTFVFMVMLFWRIAGLMLIGMGLMKLGVFSAMRSLKFYTGMIIVGYGIGLPVVAYGGNLLIEHNFDFVYFFREGGQLDYAASVLVALGHIGLIMTICKTGLFKRLTRRLAAVGRMALTNYLMHTIVMTTIFYGYGLGLFGYIDRFYLIFFVLGMWIIQLIYSPIWLGSFRFGPAEWLWRSLTYKRRQPMKVV